VRIAPIGHGGSLPFALGVCAAWSTRRGMLDMDDDAWLRPTHPYDSPHRSPRDELQLSQSAHADTASRGRLR
jgi:hypothetical protein